MYTITFSKAGWSIASDLGYSYIPKSDPKKLANEVAKIIRHRLAQLHINEQSGMIDYLLSSDCLGEKLDYLKCLSHHPHNDIKNMAAYAVNVLNNIRINANSGHKDKSCQLNLFSS